MNVILRSGRIFFENPTGLFMESALLVLRLVPGLRREKICLARGVLSSQYEIIFGLAVLLES